MYVVVKIVKYLLPIYYGHIKIYIYIYTSLFFLIVF
jgi:hypothetical protein